MLPDPVTDVPDTPASPDRTVERSTTDRSALALVGVGLAVLAAIGVRQARGFMFIVDEWDILTHHVHGDLLRPYNGHLSVVPIALYQGLAHTVGIRSYLPWTLITLTVYLAIPVAFHLTHRRRVDPLLVALAALGIAWSWAAEMNVLYAFLVNFNLPILMLVVAWALIRRDTLRSDLWAMGALALALATSSVGVVVACAIGIELVLVRAPLRRLVRFAPPVVLWALWWVFDHEATKPASIGERVNYAWNLSVAILSGFTLGWKPGAVPAALAIATILVCARRRWRTIDAHVAAIGVALVFFVVLSAYSRAGDIALNPPDAVRYVWVGDVLIVSALVWCVRGLRIPWSALVTVAVVVGVGAAGLIGHLRTYPGTYVWRYTDRSRPFLVGAEAAGSAADPDRILPLNLIPVTVGEYLDLVAAVGSPVRDVPFDDLGAEPARHEADRLLVTESPVTLRSRPTPFSCGSGRPRSVPVDTDAVRLVPGEALLVTADTATGIRLRRLARTPAPTPDLEIPAGRSAFVGTVVDHSALPWWVDLDGTVASITICER